MYLKPSDHHDDDVVADDDDDDDDDDDGVVDFCVLFGFHFLCYRVPDFSMFCILELNRVVCMYLRTLLPKTEASVNPHPSLDSLPQTPHPYKKVLTHTELQSLTSAFCQPETDAGNGNRKI